MDRDWEAFYRQGNTPWDKGYPAPPLEELIEMLDKRMWGLGPVLVPGCGFGHDVRRLASIGLPVVGVDCAPTAVAGARQFERVGEETYQLADILTEEWPGTASYSALWEHTCFCAIPRSRRADYARAAARAVQLEGVLAGVFYLDPVSALEDDGPPFGASSREVTDLLAPWFDFIEGWVPGRAYPGREGREWTAVFRRRPSRSESEKQKPSTMSL